MTKSLTQQSNDTQTLCETETHERTNFESLTNDCIRNVLTFLPMRDVARLATVNKDFHQLISAEFHPASWFREAFVFLLHSQWLPYASHKTLVIDISHTESLSFMTLCWYQSVLTEFYIFKGTKLKKKYLNRAREHITMHKDILDEIDEIARQVLLHHSSQQKQQKKKRSKIYIYFNTLVPKSDHLPTSLVQSAFYT